MIRFEGVNSTYIFFVKYIYPSEHLNNIFRKSVIKHRTGMIPLYSETGMQKLERKIHRLETRAGATFEP